MKNILNKIYLHPLFLIFTLIFILIGKIRFITYFMITIFIHEIGHIIVSLIFKWKIKKIIILPFGGLIKYNIKLNVSNTEELLVSISGIIFQYFFYLLLKSKIDYQYYSYINYFIIIFNLLPIYPLDGSKILFSILNILTSYYKSIVILCYISIVFIFIGLYFSLIFNKLFIIVFIFLLIETYKLFYSIDNLYNKFLLERYLYKLKFKNTKIITNIYKLKKDFKHIFIFNNNYYSEDSILKKMFDINKKM